MMLRMMWRLSFLATVTCGPGLSSEPLEPVAVRAQAARDRQGPNLVGAGQEGAYAHRGTPDQVLTTDPQGPDGRRFQTLTLRYGALAGTTTTGTFDGPRLVGSLFFSSNSRTGEALRLRITAVHPRAHSASGLPEEEYEISALTAAGSTSPLCDASAGNRAIATPDAWDVTGARVVVPGRFTFACTTGVVDKCVRWGYPYWRPEYAGLHQACTRMARADYCGRGEPHTVAGTVVDLYDRRGVAGDTAFLDRSPGTPALAFEAGWKAKGGAVCLSKLRWATLAPGGFCPELLPDPRFVPFSQNPKARYCEDYGVPSELPFLTSLESLGAVAFNDSAYIDAALNTWANVSTGKRYTTTTGAYEPARGTVMPAPGYTSAVFEGAVYRRDADLSTLPTGVLPLFSWYNSARGDFLTTASSPTLVGAGSGYVRLRLEGFIIPLTATPPASARALLLYQRVGGRDFVTTTRALSSDWRLVRREGYLPH